MSYVPAIISTCALLFTVGSFYWLQARKGRLTLYPVVIFSGYVVARRTTLRVPVAVFNSGAKPRVVTALRLAALTKEGSQINLACQAFRKTVMPEQQDMDDFPVAFAVPPRSVTTKYAEFRVTPTPLELISDVPVRFAVEAFVDKDLKWHRLGTVELHLEIMNTSSFITYSNHEDAWRDSQLEEAATYRESVRSAIATN